MKKSWLLVGFLAAVHADDFNYDDHGDDWLGTCETGSSQSPINIKGATDAISFDSDYRPLSISYQPTSNFEIIDEGHNYKISGSFGQLKANDLDLTGNYQYDCSQFHFHAPSEHEIDGKQYPLEMHIVHNLSPATPDNPLTVAVLGVLFKEGEKNPSLEDYITSGQSSISLSGIFGGRTEIHSYYMYKGSFTTPPCTQTVNWYVYGEVLEASAEQIAFFNELWEDNPNFANGNGNNRDIQPLNGRKLLLYGESNSLANVLAVALALLAF